MTLNAICEKQKFSRSKINDTSINKEHEPIGEAANRLIFKQYCFVYLQSYHRSLPITVSEIY